MKDLALYFSELGKTELTQEDFTSIRLKDLPENTEDEADAWAFAGIAPNGEEYGSTVFVEPDILYHVLVEVSRRQLPFEGVILLQDDGLIVITD